MKFIIGSQVDEIQIDDFIKLFPTKRGRKVKDNEVIFVKVLGFLPSTSQSLTDQVYIILYFIIFKLKF